MRVGLISTAVCGALALAVAGCGGASSTAKDSSGTTKQVFSPATFKGQTFAEQTKIVDDAIGKFPTQSGTTTRGVTKTSITVAGVTTLTTSQGVAPFPGICEGAKARFARANAAGGVGGRKINFVGCKDDGGDPARHLQLAQQAVEDQKAFAVLPAGTLGAPVQAAPYYNKTHTPYFPNGGEVGTCGTDNPYSFPVTGCFQVAPIKGYVIAYQGVYNGYAQAAGVGSPTGIRAAFVVDDTPIAPLSTQIAQLHAQVSGAKFVFASHAVPPPGAAPLTDYTTLVRQIMAKNPTLVYMNITNPTAVIGLTGALKAAGYKGGILQVVLSDPRALQNKQVAAAMDGTYALSNMALGTAQNPSLTQITKDLQGIGWKSGITYGTLLGYGAADFFLDAVAHVKGNLTTEALANTINSDGYEYPGIKGATCPLQFPLHHYTQPPCLTFGKLDAASKSIPTKLPLTNYPTMLVPDKSSGSAGTTTNGQ